eukprot:1149705-Prymnesium_polylepis.1
MQPSWNLILNTGLSVRFSLETTTPVKLHSVQAGCGPAVRACAPAAMRESVRFESERQRTPKRPLGLGS